MVDEMIYLSLSLGSVFTILALAHLYCAYKNLIKREYSPSYIPFVNGFIGLGAILLYPYSSVRDWWWLPFLLDWGCLPMLIELIVFHWRHRNGNK